MVRIRYLAAGVLFAILTVAADRPAVLGSGQAAMPEADWVNHPRLEYAGVHTDLLAKAAIVGSSLLVMKDGAIAGEAVEGLWIATRNAGRSRHDLPLGVDHQDLHRRSRSCSCAIAGC